MWFGEKGFYRPPYLLPLTCLTAVYLIFELAFNARLLDVAGGLAQPPEVDNIEFWGRIISGVAVAIAVWGLVLMPMGVRRRWNAAKWLVFLGVSAAVIIRIVFYGEKYLIDYLADKSNSVNRGIAVTLGVMQHALTTQTLHLDGVDLDKNQLDRPEGKTFIALFPAASLSTDNLYTKAHSIMEPMVRNMVVEAMGNKEAFYNNTFVKSGQAMKDSYNKYVDGVNNLNKTLNGIPERQQQAWNQYVARLKGHGLRPQTVPPRGYGRVRQDVRQGGVPVPDDWRPDDQRTFYDVVRRKTETEAQNQYRRAIETQLGAGAELPQNLDNIDEFLAQPAVQRKWREGLCITDPVTLSLRMGPEKYGELVYGPIVERKVREQIKIYEADAATFADGGSHEKEGKDAMRALLVPPIALTFSLMGALFHVSKVSLCFLRFGFNNRLLKIAVIVVVFSVSALAFWSPNAITTSRVYGYFNRQTAAHLGPLVAAATKWAIQAQPYGYPINEWVRTKILGGISYGYHPEDQQNRSTPDSEVPKCKSP